MSQPPVPRPRRPVPDAALSKRSPEFIAERDRLVVWVNDWLGELALRRNARKPLVHKTVTQRQLRVIRTELDLGQFGVALEGDGANTALDFQWFRPSREPGVAKLTEVHGTDPNIRNRSTGVYEPGLQANRIIDFSVESVGYTGRSYDYRFSVMGDGSVNQWRHDPRYDPEALKSTSEMRAAHLAFGEIVDSVARSRE